MKKSIVLMAVLAIMFSFAGIALADDVSVNVDNTVTNNVNATGGGDTVNCGESERIYISGLDLRVTFHEGSIRIYGYVLKEMAGGNITCSSSEPETVDIYGSNLSVTYDIGGVHIYGSNLHEGSVTTGNTSGEVSLGGVLYQGQTQNQCATSN